MTDLTGGMKMNDRDRERLQYPIGPFTTPTVHDAHARSKWISDIAALPAQLTQVVSGLTETQLQTPYRPDGWTVRQVVHHVPDSHMNGYIRCKLGITEDNPMVKPYDEAAWATLADTNDTPIEVSLSLVIALHHRWVTMLQSWTDIDFARPLRHPVSGDLTVADIVALYAWHGRHHVAQIQSLRDRAGWS